MPKLRAVTFGKKSTLNALVNKERKVLHEVEIKTGFKTEKEIFRGSYQESGRTVTGSIFYKGTYQNKPAVLKLQGLKLEVSDAKMIRKFEEQNHSKIIHAPKIYLSEEWSASREYGFHIAEFVDAPLIYDLPFATDAQMKEFARFYQEYRTKCITKPWIKPESGRIHASSASRGSNTLATEILSIDKWRSNTENKGRLSFEEYAPYIVRFNPFAAKHIPGLRLEFMHGELIAQHIYKLSDGTYRLFSNILWRYVLEWSDLSKNIWWNLLQIRDNSVSLETVVDYVEKWLSVYRTIPVVKRDKDFDRKINFLMLERLTGIIVGDIGTNDYWGSEEGKKYVKHMLKIYQGLFDHFANALEKY